jgi:hypothetical protein
MERKLVQLRHDHRMARVHLQAESLGGDVARRDDLGSFVSHQSRPYIAESGILSNHQQRRSEVCGVNSNIHNSIHTSSTSHMSIDTPPYATYHNGRYVKDSPIVKIDKTSSDCRHDNSNILLDYLQLPQPEIVKFTGNPSDYPRFMSKFTYLVLEKNLSELVKMSRLLQFLSGKAFNAVKDFDGIPGGLERALCVLKERFGESYQIVDSSLRSVSEGPQIQLASVDHFQSFSDKLQAVECVLKSIDKSNEVTTDHIRRIVRRLPIGDQAKWRDLASRSKPRPAFPELVAFVKRRATAINDPIYGLARSNINDTKVERQSDSQKKSLPVSTFKTIVDIEPARHVAGSERPYANLNQRKCLYCSKLDHYLSACSAFIALNIERKASFVKETRLCHNCLRTGHFASQCTSTGRCKKDGCGVKHHTHLHDVANAAKANTPAASSSNVTQRITQHRSANTNIASHLQVLPIRVYGSGENYCDTYALVDTGSNSTYICRSLAKELKIDGPPTAVQVTTLSGMKSLSGHRVKFRVSAVTDMSDEQVVEVDSALMVKELNIGNVPLPNQGVVDAFNYMQGVKIPTINDKAVRVLIGTDVPLAFVQDDSRVGSQEDPVAIHSILGWSLLGPARTNMERRSYLSHASQDRHDEDVMKQFLQIERFCLVDHPNTNLSADDRYAETMLREETYKADGQYFVPMLWRSTDVNLPNNIRMAEVRLEATRRKLMRDSHLCDMYRTAIDGYVSSGYAEEVINAGEPTDVWYLPHHPVSNPNKPNKVRVVFDAAAVYRNDSLNKNLLKGPGFTNTLIGVLIRFRQYRVAIVADVEAMFHQVKVLPRDTERLRYLWWKNGMEKPPSVFKMLVHIFGATSSPCCASYALRRAAIDSEEQFDAKTVTIAKRNFYVDDMLASVPSIDEATRVVTQLREMLKLAHFNLTKWTSNEITALSSLSSEDVAPSMQTKSLELEHPSAERALGVLWNTSADSFTFKVKEQQKPNTKRGVLSLIGTLYDPLGFISPVLLTPKIMLQSLWQASLGWDDPLPKELETQWLSWVQQLPMVQTVSIPRCYTVTDAYETQLHIFSDASEVGYGCVAYLRTTAVSDQPTVSFVFGKSRVAPLKQVSIPRLELQAATLAVRVATMIACEIELPIVSRFFWTDSMTVLGYVQNTSTRYHTFVANRLAEIHDNSSSTEWRYVPSEENPADDASRGMAASHFQETNRWLSGPSFLKTCEENWPKPQGAQIDVHDPEIKKESQTFAQVTTENPLLRLVQHHSDLSQLRTSIAWLTRFSTYIANHRHCENAKLSVEELENAEIMAAKIVQQSEFTQEIADLNSRGTVSSSSHLSTLNPVLDKGVLKVGGRLQGSTLPEASRHPIILPKGHHLSSTIVQHYHVSNAHCGVETTVALVRERYWIVGARRLTKQAVQRCVRCKRYNARRGEQMMAPLPRARLIPYDPPFTRCGVDYFGPVEIVSGRKRLKRYGCLFTCFNTRAVHLEVAPSLEADDFINTLRQFTNRRGEVKEMWSDNGTNFVGAEKELRASVKQLNDGVVEEALKSHGIVWHFQPPTASHMSGVWERLVGVVKKHLKILCGVRSLDEHRLRTLFSEVEFIVNSRPLIATSEDPADLEAISPNHFLLLRKSSTNQVAATDANDIWSRRRWKQVQQLSDRFWQRWLKEYVPLLQKRIKWTKPKRNFQPGDIVLMVNENLSRCFWPLARVVNIHLGADGLVRTVSVRSATGVYTRPIANLCLLEAAE